MRKRALSRNIPQTLVCGAEQLVHHGLHEVYVMCCGTQGIVNMHTAGWAHMDLKPDNLCIEMKNGQAHPYIIDFGSTFQIGSSKLTASVVHLNAVDFIA